ncbi:MAG: AmmeMemoRadiSam system protein B [Gemmatimonadota bacterium]|nr:MAG: AmmeMemoRadiSam system protein B [Gemmatimonadota bacterium]
MRKKEILFFLTVSIACCVFRGALSQERDASGSQWMHMDQTYNRVRGLADTVGYAHTRAQIEAVVRMCDSLGSMAVEVRDEDRKADSQIPWTAGICPHDDYVYAARVYADIMRDTDARHVLVFGVAHRARNFDLENKIIFDSFDAWQGPYGPVRVSPLRDAIMEKLPRSAYVVHDEMQTIEHSVEGLIPFLQYYNRNVQIVSVLVPYMSWQRLDQLSKELAGVLNSIIRENNLILGQDIAFLCSNDCVHYGDQDWGGKNYAPFGADVKGYEQAVQRDLDLINQHLTEDLETDKLRDFFTQLVDQEDVKEYKITWCGRFSVPFGLNCVYSLIGRIQRLPLKGYLLSYDTSVAAGELPIKNLYLGTTATSNLRHWVGYCAIGYR